MKLTRNVDGERTLAVFIDFENIGIGLNLRRDRFEIGRVLERLVEKGKIVCKKAYADWSRFANYTAMLHESAIELIEIPKRGQTGKNSADIRLCVDAMDLAYSKDHIDTFVIVSGDSDFSPLVSKLKELGKHVIGLGLAEATSDLLRDNCDEFIYYDDLDRVTASMPRLNQNLPEGKQKVFNLLVDSLLALRRENKEVLFSSMVKDTMKRKKPSFNEEYHGYRTFSELLEDAAALGVIEIEKHKTSGTYVVTRFGSEPRPHSHAAIEHPRQQHLAARPPQAIANAPLNHTPPLHQPAPRPQLQQPPQAQQVPAAQQTPRPQLPPTVQPPINQAQPLQPQRPVTPPPAVQQPPQSFPHNRPAPQQGRPNFGQPQQDRRPNPPRPQAKPVEPELNDDILDAIEGRYLDD